MYLYATLRISFFLLFAWIIKPDVFKRLKSWIIPVVIYGLVDLWTSYIQYYGSMNPIIVFLVGALTEILLIYALFKYKPLRAFVFSQIMMFYSILPEIILLLPVALLVTDLSSTTRIDQNYAIFSYVPSYVIFYFMRQQLRSMATWFEACSEEFMIGLLVISLNTKWFMIAINAITFDADDFSSEAQMIYMIFIGSIIINILPASMIYQSIRKANQQSKAHNIVIAKGMLADYLTQVHDLKNIAHVLNITPSSDALREISIVEKMIELKKKRAEKNGIELIMSTESQTHLTKSLESGHPFFNSLDCSIITGIFLDNAIEHVKANETLVKKVTLNWNLETHTFEVTNAITPEGIQFLQDQSKGKSTKTETLLSGYGLNNAKILAEQMQATIERRILLDEVTFGVGMRS